MIEYERKRVKVRKVGGSPSVVLPKAWVDDLSTTGEVDLVRGERSIVIETPREAQEPDFENDRHFGIFLSLLMRETDTTPPLVAETAELLRRGAELTAGVELDD